MSQMTQDINRITSTILGLSMKLLFYALVFFLLYEGAVRGYQLGHEVFEPTAVADSPDGGGTLAAGSQIRIEIEEGDSVFSVAKQLKEKGLIKEPLACVLQAKLYEYEVYPGSYEFNTTMTSRDMLQQIDAAGSSVSAEEGEGAQTGE